MKHCPQCQQQYPDTHRVCPTDGTLLSLQDPYHLLGRVIASYKIDALIGMGGMGAVYSAHQSGIERRVAFKILQPNIALSNKSLVELFQREARIAGKLNHQNIAVIYASGRSDDDVLYIAMEWIEGRTLEEELAASKHLSLERASSILSQTAAALDAAHNAHIVHRDLKPSNVMLVNRPGGQESVKVLDFGIGKIVSDTAGSPASQLVGTPHYASPEQFQLGVNIDRRSDIYSLGVLLFQALTGVLPFDAPSLRELIHLHLTAPPPPIRDRRPDVPVDIERLIHRMLAKEPALRPQRAGEVAEHFAAAIKSTETLPVEQAVNTPRDVGVEPEMAHVLFMDLIGYSRLPMDQQAERIQQLQQEVFRTSAFRKAQSDGQLLRLPTGDGMALVFLRNPEAPIKCAVEIARALRQRPNLSLRMGIHSGPVYQVPDINGNRNVAGGGINLAQRVMDCGGNGHILLSKSAADILSQFGTWAECLHDLGHHQVKHGVELHLFNLSSSDFGNAEWPEGLHKTSQHELRIERLRKLTQHSSNEIDLHLWAEAVGVAQTRDWVPDKSTTLPVFRLGDKLAICARARQSGCLWITHVGASGSAAIIFPRAPGEDNLVEPDKIVRIIGTLEGNTGVETVHAFVSRAPLSEISQRLANAGSADRAADILLGAEELAIQVNSKEDWSAVTIQFTVTK